MVTIPFLKKFIFPRIPVQLFEGKPARVAGIDIGARSTKVVQLRYEAERAILETYGELLNEQYFKTGGGTGTGFLRYLDSDIISLLKDILREANITARDAVLSIPASSSFMTTISFPRVPRKELDQAMPYEARKYVPIPVAEVALDWAVFESEGKGDIQDVLLVAVPKEVVAKFKRVAVEAGLTPRALEVETFSLVRSLVGEDQTPTAIINIGYLSTTLAIVDKGRLRVSHNFGRGANELTRALEKGLGVSYERAEAIKREAGISERLEEREMVSVITPLMEALLDELERSIAMYNRKAERKIQKINLTGGGSHLKGIVEHAAARFGIEVSRGNPFQRVITPAFLQPLLQEIGPNFSVAVGLALREITGA